MTTLKGEVAAGMPRLPESTTLELPECVCQLFFSYFFAKLFRFCAARGAPGLGGVPKRLIMRKVAWTLQL